MIYTDVFNQPLPLAETLGGGKLNHLGEKLPPSPPVDRTLLRTRCSAAEQSLLYCGLDVHGNIYWQSQTLARLISDDKHLAWLPTFGKNQLYINTSHLCFELRVK